MAYRKCLKKANKEKRKLCPRGYCTAKAQFEVYPSAYANAYATQVCQGKKADYSGKIYPDYDYLENMKTHGNDLKRWFREQWVNVCEKGDGPGGYALCGTGKGIQNPKKYPYCRAYYRLPGTSVVTAQELSKQEIKEMCKKKRSLSQGVKGKPTRVYLKDTRSRKSRKSKRSTKSKSKKQSKKTK